MKSTKRCICLVLGVVFFILIQRKVTYEITVGRLKVRMQFVPFDQLALKWGVSSNNNSWTGESNFTDIAYTLEDLSGDGIQAARVVWTPVSFNQPETTAIIIPFRNRAANLSVFLNHMHPFLRHQRRRYTIFVIEQVTPETFNKGALMNTGFREAIKTANFTCFIFHDVDLLPEDDRMTYGCEHQPLHMSATIDKFNYTLYYNTSFGGAVAMTRTQFEKTLGYANTYFGWGCEDDDMYRRLGFSKQTLLRRNFTFARYKMMKHVRDTGNEINPKRKQRLKVAYHLWRNDTYRHVQYAIRQKELRYNGLYYHFKVDILYPILKDSIKLL
ncbi:unnamed protein product [Schistocephalus solidus]|uniref:Beta-1,4-galactosyltransferase n=1 Tax=Schistocephalus solidus TaxID=70667 RepID=A0A183SZ82_SCHSO|nr:unnamed protein product [Schistocephalus solidus]